MLGALLTVSGGGLALAKDRIYVDQWSPTRSELMIADADGTNARKLVPGLQIDYNASFSSDGEWVVFTSERSAARRHPAAVRRAVRNERRRLGTAGVDRQPLGGRHAGVERRWSGGAGEEEDAVVGGVLQFRQAKT